MKKLCLILCTALLLALCACSRESVQKLPTQVEQERSIARFTSQQELRYYLEDHAALAGNLPAFCEATKNGVPEKLQAGAEILEKGREQFAAYLFVRLEHMPEDAFADDAAWTLSDTSRGNLLLDGEGVHLLYCAETDEVRAPKESGEMASETLDTRIVQASAAPGIDRDGPQVQALTGYLRENPEVFCDDGISVFEDTAWMLRQGENGAVLLSFLRESPFCGLSCCSLSATRDGQVRELPQQCLDEGWFLDEAEDDYLLKRFSIAGCDEQTTAQMAAFLQEQSRQFVQPAEEFPIGVWDILEDAKKAVWLYEADEAEGRLLFLLPENDRYRSIDPDASTIVLRQLFLQPGGEICQTPGGVLWTQAIDENADFAEEYAVEGFSLFQLVEHISPDRWEEFDRVEPCAQAEKTMLTESWRSYSNGRIMICIPDELNYGVCHIHLLTNDVFYRNLCLGLTEEQFWRQVDLSGISHTKYPERQRCLLTGANLCYELTDGLVSALWLAAHF